MKRFWGPVAFGVLLSALGVGLLSCVPIDSVPPPVRCAVCGRRL